VGIMFICGMVLRCAGKLKPGLSLDQLQQIWQLLSYIPINKGVLLTLRDLFIWVFIITSVQDNKEISIAAISSRQLNNKWVNIIQPIDLQHSLLERRRTQLCSLIPKLVLIILDWNDKWWFVWNIWSGSLYKNNIKLQEYKERSYNMSI